MNRQEFMNQLEQQLKAHQDETTIKEVLADFDEYFNEAIASGKTEEEICNTIGDPVEIADQFQEETKVFEVTSPSDSADINIALYNINVICNRHMGSNFDVKIMQWERVVEDSTITVVQSNGGLEITQSKPLNFAERFLNVFDNKKVYIDIPANFDGNINIKMAYGNLNMDGINAKSISSEMLSGNLKFSQVKSESDIDISCKSGNIHLKNCFGETTIKGISGNIHVKSHSGSVSAETISGNVKVETDCIKKDCRIKGKSGNFHIDIASLKANLEIQGLSGNLDLTVGNVEGNIAGSTKSGNIRAYFNADVKAMFGIQSSEIKNDFQSSFAQKSEIPFINLSTRHGLVRVKKI